MTGFFSQAQTGAGAVTAKCKLGVPPGVLRKLTSIEAAMAYAHAELGGNTQASFLMSLRGDVSRADCAAPLSALIARQEILSCTIREVADDLWFVASDEAGDLPLEEMQVPRSMSVEGALEREAADILDPGRRLWRLRILRESNRGVTHLVLTQHHAITDAATAQAFFTELLGRLDAAPSPESHETLTPGVDALLPQKELHPPSASASARPLAFLSSAALQKRHTGVCIEDLNPAESTKALAVARCANVSLHSILVGLFVDAFCDAIARPFIDVFTAVSLRERLVANQRIDDYGCYICVPACPVDADGGALAAATRYSESLKATLAKIPAPLEHFQLRAKMTALRDATHFSGIGVTNLGVIDSLADASRREIIGYRPAVARVGANLALTLHIVRFRSRIHLTLTYPRPLMSDAIVQQTALSMKQRLNEL